LWGGGWRGGGKGWREEGSGEERGYKHGKYISQARKRTGVVVDLLVRFVNLIFSFVLYLFPLRRRRYLRGREGARDRERERGMGREEEKDGRR
jgi:hypothetical protein